jgi:NAD(P)H-hydrate epimerase
MKLARAEQMQRIDAAAINDLGLPGVVLMENAGRETVRRLCRHFGEVGGKTIAVFAGPGNNGGDGFVAARHLQQLGARVTVFLPQSAENIRGDAAVFFRIVVALGIPVRLLLDQDDVERLDLASCALIVDALFGTGLRREITGHLALLVDRINGAECPVVAVDMPSGVDSDSGKILGRAVRAALTVTFAAAKPGHFVFPGRELAGAVEIADIGIPSHLLNEAGLSCELLDRDWAASHLDRRRADSHKGTSGHLLVVAGATGKTGAAILCCRGALRAGAGLVSLGAAASLNGVYAAALPEAMTLPLTGGPGGAAAIDDLDRIVAALRDRQAAVMGPGLGTAPETALLVQRLYQEAETPLVLDADAINVLAADRAALVRTGAAARVLTPHPGEMARLTGGTGRVVQENRLETARRFAAQYNVYLVLKGAGTIVASPDGLLAVNGSGNPGMAAGGMGDVLSGMIGGLLVQGYDPWRACCLGVFLHGRAADLLAAGAPFGYLAGEVADRVPSVINELMK